MANPLFNLFNGTPANPMQNMISQFNQFKNMFKGDPRQQVQSLLNSGRMTQDQYNQIRTMATQFRDALNK